MLCRSGLSGNVAAEEVNMKSFTVLTSASRDWAILTICTLGLARGRSEAKDKKLTYLRSSLLLFLGLCCSAFHFTSSPAFLAAWETIASSLICIFAKYFVGAVCLACHTVQFGLFILSFLFDSALYITSGSCYSFWMKSSYFDRQDTLRIVTPIHSSLSSSCRSLFHLFRWMQKKERGLR